MYVVVTIGGGKGKHSEDCRVSREGKKKKKKLELELELY